MQKKSDRQTQKKIKRNKKKNHEKTKKSIFFICHTNLKKKLKKNKKKIIKKNPFCFSILGIWNYTRALQSSQFLKEKVSKIQKI